MDLMEMARKASATTLLPTVGPVTAGNWVAPVYTVSGVTSDRDDTAIISRLLRGLGRVEDGLKLQHSRILAYNGSVPVQYEGTDYELRVHTDPEIDLDYYAIELGRLIFLTEEIDKLFRAPAEIGQARAAFLAVAPQAKSTRNALMHFDQDPRLDNVVFLGGAIRRLHPDGRVEHLVDARYEQHDAALSFASAVGQWLHGRLHEALAADPAAPLKEQIAVGLPGRPERDQRLARLQEPAAGRTTMA